MKQRTGKKLILFKLGLGLKRIWLFCTIFLLPKEVKFRREINYISLSLQFSTSDRFAAVHFPFFFFLQTFPPPQCSSSYPPPPPDTPALLPEPANPKKFWGQIHFSCLGSLTNRFLFFFSVNRSPTRCQCERINEMFWLQRPARTQTHRHTHKMKTNTGSSLQTNKTSIHLSEGN